MSILLSDFAENTNLILTGFRASGKTTVGKNIATKFDKTFLDLDQVLQKITNQNVQQIVQKHGWESFRFLESLLLLGFLDLSDFIRNLSSNYHKFFFKLRVNQFSINLQNFPKQNFVLSLGGGVGVNFEPVQKYQNEVNEIFQKINQNKIDNKIETGFKTNQQIPNNLDYGTFQKLILKQIPAKIILLPVKKTELKSRLQKIYENTQSSNQRPDFKQKQNNSNSTKIKQKIRNDLEVFKKRRMRYLDLAEYKILNVENFSLKQI